MVAYFNVAWLSTGHEVGCLDGWMVALYGLNDLLIES